MERKKKRGRERELVKGRNTEKEGRKEERGEE